MSAPTTLPTFVYDSPLVNPTGGGLYAASTGPLPMPDHWYGGIEIWPVNCASGFGTWTDPCFDVDADPDARKDGERADPLPPFTPVTVWGYDECALITQSADATLTRARQNQRLHEQTLVEAEFGARLLDEATDLGTADDIVAAVAALESALAAQGIVGVIHAGAQWAAYAATKSVASGSPILRSPLSSAWAFGGGYIDVLGDTIVATGPTTVWASPLEEHATPDTMDNLMAAMVERSVVVGYECFAVKVTIKVGGGGGTTATTITSPADGATVNPLFPISGRGEPGTTLELYIDGGFPPDGTPQDTTVVDAAGRYTFIGRQAILPGTHTVEVRPQGEDSGATTSVTVPEVTIEQPRPSEAVEAGTLVTGYTESKGTVELYVDDTLTDSGTATSPGAFSLDPGTLAAGPHTLEVRLTSDPTGSASVTVTAVEGS